MPGIRTNAAAAMLGISTSTLRTWERRYGFPRPVRSPGGHRQYALAEIEARRLTLADTLNVSSAIALAQERGEGLDFGGQAAARHRRRPRGMMWLSPAIEPSRMRRALRAPCPSAIVVTATSPSLDAIGRLIYAVRTAAPDVAVFDYRGAVPDGGAGTVLRLGERPLAVGVR